MFVLIVLIVSTLLKFYASWQAFALIALSRSGRAWACISAAILLMALRRAYSTYEHLTQPDHAHLSTELIALCISVLIVIGLGNVAPLLRRIQGESEAHRESQATLRAAIDNLPHAFWATDVSGRIVLQNPASRQRDGSLMGMDVRSRPREGIEGELGLNDLLARAAAGEVVHFDATVGAGEDRRWYHEILAPIHHAERTLGIIGLAVDVTDRRRIQIEREELQFNLMQGQKLESLGLLAGGVAHDFNNFLTSILGYAAIASTTIEDGAPARDCLDQIEKAARRAADLTRRLLTFAGDSTPERVLVDPVRVFEDGRDLLGAATARNVRLSITVDPTTPSILCGPSEIDQMAMNLVINASEACEEKGGDVRVVVRPARPNEASRQVPVSGEWVLIEVSDDGCGMDETTRRRIFDPFFSTKFTGRGLGLAALQGIVRRLEGHVSVESQKGRGTRFQVFLPAAARTGESSGPSPTPTRVQGATILAIDDEKEVLDVMRQMLESGGFRVITARDGPAGLASFEAHRQEIALVLLDVTMPEMNGPEVLERIRRIDAQVPVLFVSGYVGPRRGDTLALRTHAAFLAKPFSQDALVKRIQTLLGGAELDRES